jgi:mRNA interferase MazF
MEIVLVEIPKQDGKEQFGLRPAILISKPVKDIAIIVPMTSNLLALRFNHTIRLEPTMDNGLSSESIILCFQIRAIDTSRIKKKLGFLAPEIEQILKRKIKRTLNF